MIATSYSSALLKVLPEHGCISYVSLHYTMLLCEHEERNDIKKCSSSQLKLSFIEFLCSSIRFKAIVNFMRQNFSSVVKIWKQMLGEFN